MCIYHFLFSSGPSITNRVESQPNDSGRISPLLSTPPPPLPNTAPPGKAMSLQSDGNSADEDNIDDIIEPPEQK